MPEHCSSALLQDYQHLCVCVSSDLMDCIFKGSFQGACTCRSIVFSLGQVASFEDHHGQSVGGRLVTQGEQ